MNDIYKNIENYNPSKKQKILIVFDDMIAMITWWYDMISNKKLNPVVIELFISGRKFNISLVFITQSYARLNSKYYFDMKIPRASTNCI